METLYILPQKIFKFKCDSNLLDSTLELIREENWFNARGLGDDSPYLKQTVDKKLNKSIKYKNIHNWIEQCLIDVHKELRYDCDGFKITQSWANKCLYDKSLWPHYHSNSFISGILYLTNSSTNTFFTTTDFWDKESCLLMRNEQVVTHEQPSVAGDLIIFPSSLPHAVGENKSHIDRYTLSFNAFPSGNIGSIEHLVGLEIDIK